MGDDQSASPERSGRGSDSTDRRALGVIAVLLWLTALVIALRPGGNPVPTTPIAEVAAAELDTSPRFTAMTDEAVAVVALFERKCSECHDGLVDNTLPRLDVMGYHDNINMDHGLNVRCVNCHHPEDRNSLVMRDGAKVSFGESQKLCSNCHGPAYRQWQRGVHGKTLGYWDSTRGERRQLKCVECHDPHSPHYQPMTPLPAPHTLRMGQQDPAGHGHDPKHAASPLMRAAEHHQPKPSDHQ